MQNSKQNKSLIKRNILEYLNFKGISRYEFYKKSGISRGTLDNTSGLTEENIGKVLAYCTDLNLVWMLTGTGEMLVNPVEGGYKILNNTVQNVVTDVKEHYLPDKLVRSLLIPLYATRQNSQIVSIMQEVEEHHFVEDHLIIPGVADCDGAVYCTVDNMQPILKPGDIVVYKVIDDEEHSWMWEEMYLLAVDIEGSKTILLNYVRKSEKGEEFIALSNRSGQQPERDIHISQILVFAIVKASIRIN